MPSFRALPPSLLGAARTRPVPDVKRIHVPVARAMVDCAVYVDGSRLPGKFTHAAAHQAWTAAVSSLLMAMNTVLAGGSASRSGTASSRRASGRWIASAMWYRL